MEEWTGIADADRHLGRPVPLPTAVLPLTRWVEVRPLAAQAVEVEWNLDDTRPGARGRLALYAGTSAPAERPWDVAPTTLDLETDGNENGIGVEDGDGDGDGNGEGDGAPPTAEHRTLALDEAEPALRPAHELRWRRDGLHLRLTAQGPWSLDELRAIAASVRA